MSPPHEYDPFADEERYASAQAATGSEEEPAVAPAVNDLILLKDETGADGGIYRVVQPGEEERAPKKNRRGGTPGRACMGLRSGGAAAEILHGQGFLSSPELAKMLGINAATMSRWIASKRVEARQVGVRWYVRVASFAALLGGEDILRAVLARVLPPEQVEALLQGASQKPAGSAPAPKPRKPLVPPT